MMTKRMPVLRAPRRRLIWVFVSFLVAGLLFAPWVHPDLGRFAGVAAAIAGFMLYAGLTGQFSEISLSRRLALLFLSILFLWVLAILLPNWAGPIELSPADAGNTSETRQEEPAGTDPDSTIQLQDSIKRLSCSANQFFSSITASESNSPFSEVLGILGNATGATAELFVEMVFSASNVRTADSMHMTSQTRPRDPRLLLITLFGAAASIFLLVLLRGLVLVDRKRSTLRTFRVLVILVFLQVLYVTFGLEKLAVMKLGYLTELSVNIPYVLVIIWAVVNGFRNKWIHYLNRSGKYLLLLSSGVTTVLSWNMLQIYLEGRLTIVSISAGTFWGAVVTITTIYSCMAFISILMHLPSAKLLDTKFHELRTLQGLSRTVHATIDRERLAEIATDLGRNLIGADYSWVVLLSNSGGFDLRTASGIDVKQFDGIPDNWYRNVMEKLANSDGCILMNNFPRSSLARGTNDMSVRIGSLLAAMIELQGERIGILLAAGSRQFMFTDDTRGLYSSFALQIAVAFSNSRLIESSIERERLEEELNLARGIQMSLLPGKLPSIHGYEVSAISVPSRKVGGDFYDMICMADKRCAVAIADVAGKGASAALLMAALQAGLHALLEENADVAGIVRKLNSLTYRRMPDDKFITFFLGFLDPHEQTFTYCSAGHDHPLLLKADGSMKGLGRGGLVLGIYDSAEYDFETVSFTPGDRLILYTDGITETFGPDGQEEFGRDRLINIIRNHPDLSAVELMERIIFLVDSFRGDAPQTDDMTLVVISGIENNND